MKWDYTFTRVLESACVCVCQHAMKVMGLTAQQQNVLNIVAGVLHLGNIDFIERNNYAEIANQQC